MVEMIRIPDLIGDPDVPIALVKEPTRTVKIHPLTHDISSKQIKEALRFCRSNISNFILGSSRTDAFVEFEVWFYCSFSVLSSKSNARSAEDNLFHLCFRRKMAKREHLQSIQLAFSTNNCLSLGLIYRGQPWQGFQTCQNQQWEAYGHCVYLMDRSNRCISGDTM